MYLNDKTNRITLRLNDEQFNFIKSNADIVGVSPSEFIRMLINTSLVTTKQIEKKLNQKMEDLGRENDKTNKHD